MPCFLIAEVGHLEISQAEVPVAWCSAAHESQVCCVLGLRGRWRWTALDTMVGHLFVSHVCGFFAGHVTADTVRLVGMVFGDEGRFSVTGEASVSKINASLFDRRRTVRVVAGGAGKTISALSLALTLQKRFPLAGRSAVRAQLSGVNEVSDIIGKILAGEESSEGASRGIHDSFAFKVTLQADRVSLAGR